MQSLEFNGEPRSPVTAATGLRAASRIELDAIRFRDFRVYPYARRLTRDGTTVEIGGRAFDLLVVLLKARGRVVSKDEIFRAVWPSTTVDESNLRFQMTVLRRLLGADRDMIKTVPGRGYLLAKEVEDDGRSPMARHDENSPTHGLAPEPVRARIAALESENLLLRRALSELALDRLFPTLRAA